MKRLVILLLVLLLSSAAARAQCEGPPPEAQLPPMPQWARHRLHGHGGPVVSVAYSPGGGHLSFGTRTGVLKMFNLQPVETRATLLNAAGWLAYSIFSFPEGYSSLITLSPVGTASVYFADDLERQQWTDGIGTIASLSTDCRYMATTFGDFNVQVWKMTHLVFAYHDTAMPKPPNGLSGNVASLSFNNNGDRLAYAANITAPSQGGMLLVWDRYTGKLLTTIAFGAGVGQVQYSDDGKLFAAAGGNADGGGLVTVYDGASNAPLPSPSGLKAPALCVAFSENNKMLAVGSADGLVTVWDVPTGKLLMQLPGHVGPVRTITFSNDTRDVASGSDDGTVIIWKVADALAGQKN
ncbi:MAG: hypothetical protein FJX76_08430 [Armatimonadetes bacterium]|nr:hypothetical protein [Armatimonadota bacterium]